MWNKGTVNVSGRAYDYSAKVYGAGSEFGIGGGRVSKLEIVDAESGKVAASYDRGWDVRPGTAIEYAALSAVLDLFE